MSKLNVNDFVTESAVNKGLKEGKIAKKHAILCHVTDVAATAALLQESSDDDADVDPVEPGVEK